MSVEQLDAVRSGRVAAGGDPMPLGLVAFAVSAFAVGVLLAGWRADPGARLALTMRIATAFGVVGQFVAGMWSFVSGHAGGATFFGVALFYLTWAWLEEATTGWAGMGLAVIAFVTAATVCIGDRDSGPLPLIARWGLPTWTPAGADASPLAAGDHHRGLRH